MDLPLNQPLDDPHAQARHDRRRFFRALLGSAAFVALLWWIKLAELLLQSSFSWLGVQPRSLAGLVGILAAPLLHGSPGHLISNTLPLLVLGTLTLSIYPRSAARALTLIWLGSGLGIWLIGRDASTHLGASGLSHGLMFLLFMLGLLRRDRPAIAALMIAFFLYGGMVLTVLPGDPQVSWEAHLSGAACGVLAAVLWFRRDPAPPKKRYSWEDEDEDALQDAWAEQERSQYEPPSPSEVPVLWQRAEPQAQAQAQATARILPFPPRPGADPGRDD